MKEDNWDNDSKPLQGDDWSDPINQVNGEDESIRLKTQREERLSEMKDKFPYSTKESRETGDFLGVNFPYVPGDPFW